MVEPTLAPEAIAKIEEYVSAIARRSELPYALAEDARRELAAHVTDLAKERARGRSALTVDVADARKAIDAMGSESGVLAAFFQGGTAPTNARAAYGRAFLLLLAILAGATTVFSLMITVGEMGFQEIFAIIPTAVAAAFGSAAIWMLSARWSILSALFVFILPIVVFGSTGNADWLIWIVPAILLVVGGIVRSLMPVGSRPVSRASFDLEPFWDRALKNWKQVGHAVLATAAILLAGVAFAGFTDVGFWWLGVVMLALVFGGVYLVGKARPWIPFAVACLVFVGSMLLFELASMDSRTPWEFEPILAGVFPAIALALDSLFVAAFPKRGSKPTPENVVSAA